MSFADRFNSRRWFISFRLSDEPISLPNPAAIVPWEREHRSDPDHDPEGCYFCRTTRPPFHRGGQGEAGKATPGLMLGRRRMVNSCRWFISSAGWLLSV